MQGLASKAFIQLLCLPLKSVNFAQGLKAVMALAVIAARLLVQLSVLLVPAWLWLVSGWSWEGGQGTGRTAAVDWALTGQLAAVWYTVLRTSKTSISSSDVSHTLLPGACRRPPHLHYASTAPNFPAFHPTVPNFSAFHPTAQCFFTANAFPKATPHLK